ncbi:B12-binding domain-containing radical SAM protein [bacterium]|nr:B12-binding domain-containing radical SAM protein [candidate division CSSED10-310 bacterium]
MKKKVVFIEPEGAPSNVFTRLMKIPLLGPLYLGTIAKENGFAVTILNENILKRHVSDPELEQADILCLSCITATINRGKTIAARYRDVRSRLDLRSKVIIGGIHASMLPEDVASHGDHIVVGEAEDIIVDVLNGAFKDQLIYSQPVENLNQLPIPDYSLIQGWKTMNVIPVMTSRGCPYNCNFCSVTEMFGHKYRWQSAQRVFDELIRIPSHVPTVFFTDDHFTANANRTEELLNLMMKKGFKKRWNAQVRTEISKNPELVATMRKAGCRMVFVGFESINPQSLVSMHKNQSIEDITRTVKVFKKNDICVHGMFMLGNDPDTTEVFSTTTKFCKKTGIDTVQYTILTPLPGTKLFGEFVKQDRLLHTDWNFYDGLHVVFKPRNMTALQLQEGMVECFRQFYHYTNACNDAFNTLYQSAAALVKKMYKNAHFPSMMPMMMKILGKGVVSDWIARNRSYMKYLHMLSTKD